MRLLGNDVVYTCELQSADGRKIVVEETQVQRLDPQGVPPPVPQPNVAPPPPQPAQAPPPRNQGPGLYEPRTGPDNQYALHNTHLPQDRRYPQSRADPAPPPYGYPPMTGSYHTPQHTPGPSNPHTHSEYYPRRS
ncbi:hypothetical protein BS47DRAFT_96488 [Hydnum rufescens UP504]|uniref:Uncharacterized protein n=1 Tax=Hydnum rufescens UP504 TaxID=1448309 RepID=A0A9P6ASS2_9AGAM|nr:hypothetical protein BS47DRAFT_96488 [Hydnum rufescens UP504]